MANNGQNPRMEFKLRKKGKVVKVEELVVKIKEIQEKAQVVLKKVQEEMKKQVDWHRGKVEEYKAGDIVLLSTKDLKWQMVGKRADKLTERFVGPYKIKRVISSNAVELELPVEVRIHLIVNISKIHRYKDQVKEQKVVLPPPVIIEVKEKYEVQKILSKRKRYGKVEYLVQ